VPDDSVRDLAVQAVARRRWIVDDGARATAPPLGQSDELIVTGTITTYREGNRFMRALLIGLGSAAFDSEVTLKPAAADRILLTAPFDKLWAWGGVLGMSKGIEEMWAETAAAVANTVARADGLAPGRRRTARAEGCRAAPVMLRGGVGADARSVTPGCRGLATEEPPCCARHPPADVVAEFFSDDERSTRRFDPAQGG